MQYLFMEIFHLKYIKFFVRYFFATIYNSDCSFAQFSGSSETKVFLASISVPMQQQTTLFLILQESTSLLVYQENILEILSSFFPPFSPL